MVRILCLHGQGTNATIFRQQMAEVIDMLPVEYQWEFYDAPNECEPAPEIQEHYPPPYLAWYSTPTVSRVAHAHETVRKICNQYGPFDMVVGFSQGAALAASVLLHQRLNDEQPSFRAAIFMGSPVPFSHRLDVGIDARQQFGLSGWPPNPFARPSAMPPYLRTDPRFLRNPTQLGDDASDMPGDSQYQMFHGTVDHVRIGIATGHVFGTRDKWLRHSQDLVHLCQVNLRSELQHDGGHEVPRTYAEELGDLVETTLAKAG